MVFSILDTPGTEAGDRTRLSTVGDLDFTDDGSIMSPTKGGNDLFQHIRGMRGDMRTPRARPPLGDRRNFASKNEFTPLLKSAAKNRLGRGKGKENTRPQTPAGLKDGYGVESPALPFNSSVMIDDRTGSSLGDLNPQGTPAGPTISSSAASTPMAILPNRGEGLLDHGRSLATLREQEARLKQIDNENFSLKLKIHFMEEALRKNGKEFNEAAIRENTELKVDKVTLQRDVKQYRRSLAQAEKDLEDYKKQLSDYADKIKRRHMSEGMQEEMAELHKRVAEKDASLAQLEIELKDSKDSQAQLEELRDEVEDLAAEMRAKDNLIDEKDEQLLDLKNRSTQDSDHQKELEETKQLLAEKEDELETVRDQLKTSSTEHDQSIKEKIDQLTDSKQQQHILERRLKDATDRNASALAERETALQHNAEQIKELQAAQRQAEAQVEKIKSEHLAELRAKSHAIEGMNNEIQSLQRKLEAADGRDEEAERLNDEIRALQNKLIEKGRRLEDKDAEIQTLKQNLQAEEDLEEELVKAEDRIHELETEQQRNLKELQTLRDADNNSSKGRSQALEKAHHDIKELEEQQHMSQQHELRLQKEINKLNSDLQSAQAKSDELSMTYSAKSKSWENERQSLSSSKAEAEADARKLEVAVAQLQETEGSLSGREARLQKALEDGNSRWEEKENLLKKEVEEASDELKRHREKLETSQAELVTVKQKLEASEAHVLDLQDKIQGLEDEIEVLQMGQDEDIDRLNEDLIAAKQETEGAKRQLRALQHDLAKTQTEKEDLQNQLLVRDSSPRAAPGIRQDLERKVVELTESLAKLRKERSTLQDKVFNLEAANESAKAENGTLQFDLQASSGTRDQLQQKLQDAQFQLATLKKEKIFLQASVTSMSADIQSLQTSSSEVEAARDSALQASRELRSQLQTVQREADRKLQAQISAYEHDIENLEQDLEDAQKEKADLAQTNDASNITITRLKNKITSLERDISNFRLGRTDRETSVEERKDLHDMLKDAKLEAEDLTLQIRERDARILAANSKETELRTQLARVRKERAAQSIRADTAASDLARLHTAHDALTSRVAELEARQRSVRFPKSSLTTTTASSSTTLLAANQAAADDKLAKRHAAELRGLAKQIEYLSARLCREESFRADLGFVKRYFSQQVAMHARCTGADLALVNAMGIATRDVLRSQERRASPPGLRAVGLMVVAALRIRKAAAEWGRVRSEHERLLKELTAGRKERSAKRKIAGAPVGREDGLRKGSRQRSEVFSSLGKT